MSTIISTTGTAPAGTTTTMRVNKAADQRMVAGMEYAMARGYAGGIAELQKLSGAQVLGSPAAIEVLRTGQPDKGDPQYPSLEPMTPVANTRVVRDGEEVRLTPTEWQLVELLVRHRGKLISQRQLLQEVWGPQYEKETNYLRVYFAQLRRKLEPEPSRPRFFITEPGMGYRFELDEAG